MSISHEGTLSLGLFARNDAEKKFACVRRTFIAVVSASALRPDYLKFLRRIQGLQEGFVHCKNEAVSFETVAAMPQAKNS